MVRLRLHTIRRKRPRIVHVAALLLPMVLLGVPGSATSLEVPGTEVLDRSAWGYNGTGGLGTGNQVDASVPTRTNSQFEQVSAGFLHSLGVDAAGTVKSWGYNDQGQLGDRTRKWRNSPVTVAGLPAISQVSAGAGHSVALDNDGKVWAWGWNALRQVGDGTTTDRLAPTRVSSLSDVVQVSAGWYHSLALKADGTVWAWGWNAYGQLGVGTTVDPKTPVQVTGIGDIVSISAGALHSTAVTADRSLYTWGWNGFGQLGDGSLTQRTRPGLVARPPGGFYMVSAGLYHNVAITAGGELMAWGWNGAGQLGINSTVDAAVPQPMYCQSSGSTCTLPYYPVWASAVGFHSFVILADSTVFSMGWSGYGVLGDPSSTGRTIAGKVPGVTALDVSAGYLHNLSLGLT
jgi:alpha-tubulin suppressor-like RCC1 family protein